MLHRPYHPHSTVSAIGEMVVRWLRQALIRWQARRARVVLESLSDETLRDIGLTRGEIGQAAMRLLLEQQDGSAPLRSTNERSVRHDDQPHRRPS